MAVTRAKEEKFRRLAQECRTTAQTLSTEQARAEMLGMADVCDHVADHYIDATASLQKCHTKEILQSRHY
jgi:pyruvate-formate lyase